MSDPGETRDFVLLLSLAKLNEARMLALLERFKTPQGILQASPAFCAEVVGEEIARGIASLKVDNEIQEKYGTLDRLGIRAVPYYADDYPQWLKAVDHFPPVLFVRGNFLPGDEVAIAIIGTRGATVYGKNIAETFARDFAGSGVSVVSGMARGIDTAAHRGAIRAKGRTIAVLGCGLDTVYPPENGDLMAEIIEHGAVISEFNIGTPPLAQNFPKRNRIISGLSMGIVAIEAKEKSGVMNTVSWALDQNKDVFAIPGNIYAKTSQGTNRLIKDGATPVTSANEVMEALGVKNARQEREIRNIELAPDEKNVWEALSCDPVILDDLSDHLRISTPQLLGVLLKLEIKGLVKQLPGMSFVRKYE
jgi:DNA processing protein